MYSLNVFGVGCDDKKESEEPETQATDSMLSRCECVLGMSVNGSLFVLLPLKAPDLAALKALEEDRISTHPLTAPLPGNSHAR